MRRIGSLSAGLLMTGVGLAQQGTPRAAPSPPAPVLAPPTLPADARMQPGVPRGTITSKQTIRSAIFDGMRSDYWVYVPAQYDPHTAVPLMLFQDGDGFVDRDGNHPAPNVLDNLIAQGRIPAMIAVFIDPGDVSSTAGTATFREVERYSREWHRTLPDSMRSVEYDTVSDRYARFVRQELLPELQKSYNLRTDAYSHAIMGLSSGGICALNAAWQMPEEFSRVISWIGSFTAIQWRETPAIPDGGQDYPDKVLREPHRNVRVWLQDGANDIESDQYGSWPLDTLRLANALKLKGYDFHLSFGQGGHTVADGAAEFPQEMLWLWRGYDPARTDETFVQSPDEAAKPPFRVSIANRAP